MRISLDISEPSDKGNKSQRQEAELCSFLEILINEVQLTKKILLGCPLELMIKEEEFYSGLN